ncbi:hypothetical protein D3C86_2014310 [compost metagenome]
MRSPRYHSNNRWVTRKCNECFRLIERDILVEHLCTYALLLVCWINNTSRKLNNPTAKVAPCIAQMQQSARYYT